VVYSAFSGKLAIDNKLKKLGIITIPNFDWRETHPLGKAQWLLLFGYLTGKQDLAKKEFAAIVKRYNEVKSQSKKSNVQTLVGNLAGDFWYAPAGGSYNATLLKDAGVNYIFKNSKGTGSLSLTLESVFSKLDSVSLWLNPGFMSKELLLANNPKAAYFPVYSKGEIYCYAYDMNRFWELSAIQPDLVLSDLQQIIDKFNSNKKLHFYKRVE
jgi:iron complex transport system substrate-binding protein